jgi:hypothetical protein
LIVRRLELGDEEVPLKEWDDVERGLDVIRESTDLTLVLEVEEEEWYLDFFSAGQGKFLVTVFRDRRRHYLIDETQEDRPVETPIGGQRSSVSARLMVDFTVGRQAARHFFESGGLDPSLVWQ